MTRWYYIAGAVPTAAALFYFILLIVQFRKMPEQTPVNFWIDGSQNGWISRYLWAPISLASAVFMVVLVLSTKPITGDSPAAAWIYWPASGIVIGSLVQANFAAVSRGNLKMWALAVWAGAVPLLEYVLVRSAAQWLNGQ